MSGDMLLDCWHSPDDLARVKEAIAGTDGTVDSDAYLMKIRLLHDSIFEEDTTLEEVLEAFFRLWVWIATGTRDNLQQLHFGHFTYKTAEDVADQFAWRLMEHLKGDPANDAPRHIQNLLDVCRLKDKRSPKEIHIKILEDLVLKAKGDYWMWKDLEDANSHFGMWYNRRSK